MLLLLSLAGACDETRGGPARPNRQEANPDAAVFVECFSLCLRPGDCQQAYHDDGICPPGFLCALRFQCSPSPTPSPGP